MKHSRDLQAKRKKPDSPEFLTVKEAATLLRTTPKAIYSKIHRHQLPGVSKVCGRILIHRPTLLEWIKESCVFLPRKV